MLSWRVALPEAPVERRAPPPGGHWPAWATWAIVGAGVAAGTLVGLAAAGTFQSKSETRYVSGGVRIQGIPGLALRF